MERTLDIYTDYLISQNRYATATGLSDLLSGEVSHDHITRFLNRSDYNSKDLWLHIKDEVRKHENSEGALILDDSIEEKPYTDENNIMCWHYSHTKNQNVKGVNIVSCLVQYDNISLPIGYEVVHKDISFSDVATKKVKRKAGVTKNEHFRKLLDQANKNNVLYKYVLADNWFGAQENMEFIHATNKIFIIGIKSNRLLALSEQNKLKGRFQQVSSLALEDGQSLKVWLKGLSFQVQLIKKIFTNEDGSIGVLYLATNDISKNTDHIYDIYKKRWNIEVYHKSIKQNSSLAKSPTKKVRSQLNHIFSSIVAFCKLEMLKVKQCTNHFALKYQLIVKANQAAFRELNNLTNSSTTCVR